MKTCTKCGTSKTEDKFNTRKIGKSGLRSWCKECRNERSKQYYLNNKIAISEQKKVFSKENKAKIAKRAKIYNIVNRLLIAEYKKAYGQENKFAISMRSKIYRQANKEKIRVRVTNRNARKRGNGGTHTVEEIKSLFNLQKGQCVCCRKSIKNGYHVDHIMPISNGGRNDKYNLQLLCPNCNQSKSAKHPIDFMQSRGFLL